MNDFADASRFDLKKIVMPELLKLRFSVWNKFVKITWKNIKQLNKIYSTFYLEGGKLWHEN